MKTDYAKLGEMALARLRETADQAELVQEKLLQEILRENRDTEYGRKYSFAEVFSSDAYRKRVPVTEYPDYEAWIARMIEGQENVLTRRPVVYFCVSSGSTGEMKYVPLTEEEFTVFALYAYGIIFGMVKEYYRELPGEEVFGKIFQIGEFAKTVMPDGRMNGIRSGSYYQWLDRDGAFDASDYCVPKEVLFPDTLEDLTYVKVRFALAERGLRAIHGVFISRVAGTMQYICDNWELLLRDMEYGTVDEHIVIGERWRTFVRERLLPDPVRAKELRRLHREELQQGLIEKLWPEVRYILAIGGEHFSYYTERMREFAGKIPIHYYDYAASEGIFAVSRRINEPDSYILIPDSGFFEFLPADREPENGETTLGITELRTGERYEFLFTSRSGLYRYRMGDVLEVTDWYGQLPVVKFCYRKNQVLNLAGEKYNVQQLEEAVRRFSAATGVEVKGFCVQEELTGGPRYLVYLECDCKQIADGERVLERCFCEANCEYAGCRRLNEIGGLRIRCLPVGSFARYEKYLSAKGIPIGQNKLLRILDTEEKKSFFAALSQEEYGGSGR